MRIGIDIKALSNNSTGIARYLKEMLDALQVIDNRNEFFLFECRQSGYSLHNQRWKKITTLWFLPGIVWQQFILPFILHRKKISVFWAPEQICPIFFMKKIKIITTVHDCVEMHFPETSQWSVRIIKKLLLRRTYQKSHFIITVSEFIRNDVLTNYNQSVSSKNIVAIPNGRPHWQQPQCPHITRDQFIFFAGNFEPRKNLINLIKAIELLSDKKKTVNLYRAGPAGWKNKNDQRYFRDSRIHEQIHNIGYCDDRELINNYLKCKAFVYPSIYEGFGLPVLEALSLDCLVLTSKGTVMEEIAGPAAIYFNPWDPADIAEKIELIFSDTFDPNVYLQFKDKILQKYSWENSGHNLINVFNSCSP
jgi:glycosyltransferase involved in cell wall biosynthesis